MQLMFLKTHYGLYYQPYLYILPGLNSSPLRQNGHHFADDSLKRIVVNEKFYISIQISLKFVPKGPIDSLKHWFR